MLGSLRPAGALFACLALAASCQVVSGLNSYRAAPGGSGGSSPKCCSDRSSCIGYCKGVCKNNCTTSPGGGGPTPTDCKAQCNALDMAADPTCLCDLSPSACPASMPKSCGQPTGAGAGGSGGSTMSACCPDHPELGVDCLTACKNICRDNCGQGNPSYSMCTTSCDSAEMGGKIGPCVCSAAGMNCMAFPPMSCFMAGM